MPVVIAAEPHELSGVVGYDSELRWVGLAEVIEQAMGGFDRVPDPARSGLDDPRCTVRLGLERFGA
jgi:hypothetical protein